MSRTTDFSKRSAAALEMGMQKVTQTGRCIHKLSVEGASVHWSAPILGAAGP